MGPDVVNLAEVPLEILEKVVSSLTEEEYDLKISSVCNRFKEAAYRVVISEYGALKALIYTLQEAAQKEVVRMKTTRNTFEDDLTIVTKFGFLQVPTLPTILLILATQHRIT